MPKVPIKFVISFSSQDGKHTIENLVRGRGSWLCSPTDKSGKLQADFQLEHSSSITHIDLGNSGSMTVSVEVGRSSWPTSQAMVSLLPTVVLMTPQDMRQGKNKNTVRMFKQADLCKETVKDKWDRVRIICTQPLRKTEQFGLSFFNLHTNETLAASNSSSHLYEPVNSTPQGLTSFKTNINLEPSGAAEARKEALVSNMNLVEVKKKNMTESLRSLEQSWMTVGEENSGGNQSRLNVTGPVSRAAKLILATKKIENKEMADKSAVTSKINLECEALNFLISLNLTAAQIYSMNVKGVREQFELKRGKALVLEEKKVFKEIALDFSSQRLERFEQKDAQKSLKSTYEKNKFTKEKENKKYISSDNKPLKESNMQQILPKKTQPAYIGNKKPMFMENKNICEERDLYSKNTKQDNKVSTPKVSLDHQNNEDFGKFKFKKLVNNGMKELTNNNPMSSSRNERAMVDSKVVTPTRTQKKIVRKTPKMQKMVESPKESNMGKWINSKNSAEKTKPFTLSKVKHLDKFESEIDNIDLGNWSDDEVQETSNRMSNGYIRDFSPSISSTQEGGFIKNVSTVKSNNLKKSFGSSSDESTSSTPWIQGKSAKSSVVSGSGNCIGGTPKDKFGLNPARNKSLAQPSPNRKRLADTSPVSSPSSKRKAGGNQSPKYDLKECPICSGFFSASEIEVHAASCLQVLTSDSDDSDSCIPDISPQKPNNSLEIIYHKEMEECPICSSLIDSASIEEHASSCAASAFG